MNQLAFPINFLWLFQHSPTCSWTRWPVSMEVSHFEMPRLLRRRRVRQESQWNWPRKQWITHITLPWFVSGYRTPDSEDKRYFYSTPRPKGHAYLSYVYFVVREHLRIGFEGPQKGPKFACMGREQNQNNGTWPLFAWPGVLEPEQKGTTPAWAQVASCNLSCTAALVHWRSSAGTAWVALRFSKSFLQVT